MSQYYIAIFWGYLYIYIYIFIFCHRFYIYGYFNQVVYYFLFTHDYSLITISYELRIVQNVQDFTNDEID